MSFVVFADSGCNLPQRKLKELDIQVVPFAYELDGELITYCTTDGPIINWVFRTGLYQILKQDGVIDDDTFCFHTNSKYVFEHVTKVDVDKLMDYKHYGPLAHCVSRGLLRMIAIPPFLC